MSLDPRTPVLVGAAVATQRLDDPTAASSAAELMAEAARRAGEDAGSPSLLGSVQLVLTPKGTWRYHDAAKLVAGLLGNHDARSLIADLGVLQTTLFSRSAQAIARGELDVALGVGGEAKWRDLRATITGTAAPEPDDAGAVPDELLRPHDQIMSTPEINAGLINAVSQYTLIENARRFADGQSIDEHADEVARLWAAFNEVAQHNPNAWNPAPMSADEIRAPGPRNRPLAFPYNKWHNSQWNVDQAAAFVLCSVEAARAHGVPEDRWVFPHAIVESNHMVPVTERATFNRSPGFEIAGRRAFELTGLGVDDVAHIDLYSCFPIAVRTQVLELGLDTDRPLTVTGGMTFGGGPLNNYVLQSTAAMVDELRRDAGSFGLVTAISGMITKQGVSLWSTRPPEGGFEFEDVSDAVALEVERRTVVAGGAVDGDGDALVATYTVLYADDGSPQRAVVVAERADGTRAIAGSADPAVAAAMTSDEWCGRAVHLEAGDATASFTVP